MPCLVLVNAVAPSSSLHPPVLGVGQQGLGCEFFLTQAAQMNCISSQNCRHAGAVLLWLSSRGWARGRSTSSGSISGVGVAVFVNDQGMSFCD